MNDQKLIINSFMKYSTISCRCFVFPNFKIRCQVVAIALERGPGQQPIGETLRHQPQRPVHICRLGVPRHGGSDKGVATDIMFSPETGYGIIILMNTSWTDDVSAGFKDVRALLLDRVGLL